MGEAVHDHHDGKDPDEGQVHPVLASQPGGQRPRTLEHLPTVRRIGTRRHPSRRRPGAPWSHRTDVRARASGRSSSGHSRSYRGKPDTFPGGRHVHRHNRQDPHCSDVRRRAGRLGGRRRGRLLDEPDVPRHARRRGAHPRGRRRRGGHHALRGSRYRPGGQGPRGRTGPGVGPDGLDDRAGLLPARPRRRDRRRCREPARRSPHPQHRGRVGVRRRVLPARAVTALPLPHRTTALPPLALGRGRRDRRLRGGGAVGPARSGPGRRGRALLGRQPDRARCRAPAGRRPRDGGPGAARRRDVGRAGRVRHPLGALPRTPSAADGVVHDRRRRPGDRPGDRHRGDSVTVEVLLATAIFGAMLFGIGWPLLGPLGSRAESAEHVARAKSEAEPTSRASSIDGPTLAT